MYMYVFVSACEGVGVSVIADLMQTLMKMLSWMLIWQVSEEE